MKRIISISICFTALAGLFMFGLHSKGLQAGDGQAILENRCTKCHGTGRIQRADHDRNGWANTVNRMMGKKSFGQSLNDAELKSLLDYLASL